MTEHIPSAVEVSRWLEVALAICDEADELAPYAEPAPAAVTACYRTFCGT